MTNLSKISFLTPYPYSILFCVLALMVWLTLMIWLIKNKPRFSFLKGLLYTFILAVFALLGLQPSIQTPIKKEKTIVLTDDFEQAKLDSIRQLHPKAKQFMYQENQSVYPDTIGTLSDIDSLLQNTDTLFILGQPPAIKQLDYLSNNQKLYLEIVVPPIPSGIQDIQISRQIAVGKEAIVQGVFNNQSDSTLTLSYTGSKEDSIQIQANTLHDFSFKTKAIKAGYFLNTLTVRKADGTVLQDYQIPMHVIENEQSKIALLSSFPTFENKYLKEYLGKAGHPIAIKSKISKDNFRYDFVNQNSFDFEKIDKKSLNKIDMLILDEGSLSLLSESEYKAITNAVINEGLSVLLFVSSTDFIVQNKLSKYSKLFSFKFNSSASTKSTLNIENESFEIETPPYSIQKTNNTIPIIKDQSKQILATYDSKGLGKIGIICTKSTYPLLLSGKKESYQVLWSKILTSMAANNYQTHYWQQNNYPCLTDEPCDLQLISNQEKPIGLVQKMDNAINKSNENWDELYLAQDPFLSEKWTAKYRFRESGWHWLNTKEKDRNKGTDSKTPVYIYDAKEWQTLNLHKKQMEYSKWLKKKEEKRQIDTNIDSNKNQQAYTLYETKAVSAYWFYLVLLLLLGLLWLIEKIE